MSQQDDHAALSRPSASDQRAGPCVLLMKSWRFDSVSWSTCDKTAACLETASSSKGMSAAAAAAAECLFRCSMGGAAKHSEVKPKAEGASGCRQQALHARAAGR